MEKIKRTVEQEIPPLSYELIEGILKNLQGKVLTQFEASITNPMQLNAAKDLVKSHFNDKLTMLFDWYGEDSELEIPNYSQTKVDADGCQCNECKKGYKHTSDCAVHNEPAERNGDCTCKN